MSNIKYDNLGSSWVFKMAMVILIILVAYASIFVWFWGSYKVFDNDKVPFEAAIIIAIILSALLGVEFLFLIELMIGV